MCWSAIGIIATGLPAAMVLIVAATLGAIIGIVTGAIDASTLWALPSRLINLFENDLLQALPLYVTMGLLLDRLPIADALYRAGNAVLPRSPSAPLVSGMMLGALLGPMNGSVGASVLGLSRVVSPRLAAEGIEAPVRHAIVAVASTLGVLVPPSLVLILLSDAMLSAHTIAVTATGRTTVSSIRRTSFTPHSCREPFFSPSASRYPGSPAERDKGARPRPPDGRPGMACGRALVSLVVLLGGVTLGYFYAVEAAAMGAFALLAAGLLTGRLHRAALSKLLSDAIALTGALFSLLVAATTFTMVLRLLGTADLVGKMVSSIPGGDIAAVAVVLCVLGISAFVLDAFEIIFVDRADRDSAASDPHRRRAVGRGPGAADLAIEFSAAAFRLRADDGAWRSERTGRLSPVPARAGAVPRSPMAVAAPRTVVPATDPRWTFRRRCLTASGGDPVG